MSDAQSTSYEALRELIFSTAQRYVEAGLWIVSVHSANCANRIKRGKAPTHAAWQKTQLSWRALEHEMNRVWSQEGGCNIGLKTGKDSGLICIDVDQKSNGLAWFLEHESHLGRPVIERTGGGDGEGLHLYYRYPQALREDATVQLLTRSSGKRLFRGVDILGDGHGQVVTWPSLHGVTKKLYTFDNKLDLVDALHEADELPRWIVDEILMSMQRQALEDAERSGDRDTASAVALEADIAQAVEFVSGQPGAVEGQGGDFATLKVAMRCKDFGLNEAQILEVLVRHFNPRCVPQWSTQELRDKIKNAFRYGKKTAGVNSVHSTFDDISAAAIDEAVTQSELNSGQGKKSKDKTGDEDEVAAARGYNKRYPLASAEYFIAENSREIRGFGGNVCLYDWSKNCWCVLTDRGLDAQIIRHMQSCPTGQKAIKAMKPAAIADIRKFIQANLISEGEIPAAQWLNQKHEGDHYLTVANGILDLQSVTLMPHDPAWFSFHAVNIDFDATVGCPQFLEFLNQIWEGDEEIVSAFQLWFGYCLMTSSKLQKFAVFKGASRAGKSTLMAVIEGVVGRSNCTTTSLSLIGSDFGLEGLVGRKLVIFQDAEKASIDRMSVATERIKSLASDDPITINRKNQSMLTQRLSMKVNFVCNRVPPFLNDEGSLTKRMILFPFWKSFEGREDFDLADKLLTERQGIFNWALMGAHRLLHGGKLHTPAAGMNTLAEVQQQLDSVVGFAAECLQTGGEHNFLHAREVWSAYRTWCRDSGRAPKNRQRFFMEVSALEPLRDRKSRVGGNRGWRGVVCDIEASDSTVAQFPSGPGGAGGDDDEPPF